MLCACVVIIDLRVLTNFTIDVGYSASRHSIQFDDGQSCDVVRKCAFRLIVKWV